MVIQFNLFPQISLPIASAKEIQEGATKERAFGDNSKALSFAAGVKSEFEGTLLIRRLTKTIQRAQNIL